MCHCTISNFFHYWLQNSTSYYIRLINGLKTQLWGDFFPKLAWFAISFLTNHAFLSTFGINFGMVCSFVVDLMLMLLVFLMSKFDPAHKVSGSKAFQKE